MGGGPKASAANLEPLGKRRNFGNPASLSEPKSCASLARDVGERGVASAASSITNSRTALLSSTARTATDRIVSKDNTASEPVNPALCNLPYEDQPPQTIKATGDDDNDERSERQPDAGSANQVKKPICRAPSPQTRVEISARALALAQEWQAKFKALPKQPALSNWTQGITQTIDMREQIADAENDQHTLKRRQSQPAIYRNEELGALESAAAHKLDEAASHKRRRESGTGPQASAANLESLGKRRRGCTLRSSADGISTFTVPRQEFSLNRAVDKPITVVHGPQVDTVPKATGASELKQNGRLLNVMGPAVGSLTRPPMIRATAAAFEHLTPESEVGRREAEEEYDRPLGQIHLSVGNDKYGNDTRFEGTARTHTPSPQRLREKYDNAGRRYDRDHKGHSVRDEVLGRNRSPLSIRQDRHRVFPREAHRAHAASVRDDRVSRDDHAPGSTSYPHVRKGPRDHMYPDRRAESRMGEGHRTHQDVSFRERSSKRAHLDQRDRSSSPRRSYHNLQDSRDHHQRRGERPYRQEKVAGDSDIATWSKHESSEYQGLNLKYPYDQRPRPTRHGHHEYDRRQRSRSPGRHRRSGERSGYRGYNIDPNSGEHRDDRYRTRDRHRP